MTIANYKGYDSPFAKRLRELIELNGTKHSELANKNVLNVSRQSIGQYCNGTSLPPIDKIAILAKYFNVSSDYLLGLTDVKTTNTDLKAVCEYVGLSETTIEDFAQDNNAFKENFGNAENYLFETFMGYYLCGSMRDIIFSLISFIFLKSLFIQAFPSVDLDKLKENIPQHIVAEYEKEAEIQRNDVRIASAYLNICNRLKLCLLDVYNEFSAIANDCTKELTQKGITDVESRIGDMYSFSELYKTYVEEHQHERSGDNGEHKKD